MLICWGATVALISASGALEACQYMSGRPNQRSNKPLTCARQSNHRAGKYMEMNATERPSITAVLQTWLMLLLFTTPSQCALCVVWALLWYQTFCNLWVQNSQVSWYGKHLNSIVWDVWKNFEIWFSYSFFFSNTTTVSKNKQLYLTSSAALLFYMLFNHLGSVNFYLFFWEKKSVVLTKAAI